MIKFCHMSSPSPSCDLYPLFVVFFFVNPHLSSPPYRCLAFLVLINSLLRIFPFWLSFLVIPLCMRCAGVDTRSPSDDSRTRPSNTMPLNDSWTYRRTPSGTAHCGKLSA